MTIRRRLTVGAAWMFAGSWAEQTANFLVFVALARILGPEVFGLAAMATVFVLLGEFLVRETIAETIVQLPTVEEGHLDAVFWMLGSLAIGVAALVSLSAPAIAELFSEPEVADYVVWATPTILFIGLSGVPVARLRRDLEFRALALRATLGVVAGGIVGITLALKGFGVWSLIAQRLVQVFVNNLLAWIVLPWRPGLRASRRHFGEVFGFGSKMVGMRASELLSTNAPSVVIGSFLGPVALGQYTVAWRLIEILTFVLIVPIRYVAQPGFAHLNRSTGQAGRLLREVMDATSLVTLPAFVGMIAVGGTAMVLVFGEEWRPAAPALKVLCLVGVYLSIERLQQSFCIALGRAGGLLVATLAEAVVGIAAMLLAVGHGLEGVAAGFAAGYYVVWPFRILLVTRLAGIPTLPYVARFGPPLAGSLVLLGAVSAWQAATAGMLSDPSSLLSSCVVGMLVYGAWTALTMRRRVAEVAGFLRADSEEA